MSTEMAAQGECFRSYKVVVWFGHYWLQSAKYYFKKEGGRHAHTLEGIGTNQRPQSPEMRGVKRLENPLHLNHKL